MFGVIRSYRELRGLRPLELMDISFAVAVVIDFSTAVVIDFPTAGVLSVNSTSLGSLTPTNSR